MRNVFHENLKIPKRILGQICKAHSHKLTYTEAKEALEELIAFQSFPNLNDTLELDGAVYRCIGVEVIDKIFAAEVQARIEGSFDTDNLTNPDTVPSWLSSHVVIDWASVVKAEKVGGYASELGGYDDTELFEAGIYIFRTQ